MLSPQALCALSVLGLLPGLSELDKGKITWLIAAPLAGLTLSVCRMELERTLAQTGIGGWVWQPWSWALRVQLLASHEEPTFLLS